MTRVQGDLKIITGTAEAVTEVWVRSKTARPVSGGWLMTANDRKPVFDGKVDLELLPGACVLVAVSSGLPGETVELIVPESGTATLEACIRAAESAGDLERDALDELRRDFGAWIDEARASVGAADGSAKAAKAEADKAKGSADAAGKSATAAAGSASAAKTSADNAGKSATAADGSATAADKSRSDASSFANSAKTASESATSSAQATQDNAKTAAKAASAAQADAKSARDSATSAKNDADRAKTSADSAGSSASAAGSSADAAKGAADAAGKSATAAAGSASAAKADAGKAATSATAASKSASAAKADADRAENVIDNVDWHNDRLMVMGKISPPLKGDKGDKGEPGESGASTWDTVTGKPSVFPPEPHKHKMSDITDLPEVTQRSTGWTIARRLVSGQISVGEPSSLDHATTKKYVDDRDAATLAEARALVGSRPAFFSGSGAPPSSIPGAVVGDYYLDETTMELHKITGV